MGLKKASYRTIFLVLFSLFCFTTQAQWIIGVRSGINLGKHNYFVNDEEFAFKTDEVLGFEVGVLVERNIKWGLGMKSEINFIQKGGDIPGSYLIETNELEASLFLNYRFKINKFSLFLEIGGFGGYFLNGKRKRPNLGLSTDLDFDSSNYNRVETGIAFGGGLAYDLGAGFLFFESRQRYSFPYFQDVQLEDYHLFSKNLGFGLNLGYAFRLQGKQ